MTRAEIDAALKAHAANVEASVPAHHRYDIPPAAVEMLKGAAVVPADLRALLLRQYADAHGLEALVSLFAEFMGLANRVAANAEEAAIICLIGGGFDPHQAEKVNAPSIFGALDGVRLAAGIDCSKTCSGCAFRLGTVANTSPCTTADAEHCVTPGEIAFSCHEDLDERGEPTKACAGWAQARKKEQA